MMVSGSKSLRIEPEKLQRLKNRAKESLYFFAKGVCGFDWLEKEIHKPICQELEDYHKNKRLKVTLPRGWLKTTICSQAYPLWRAINNPNVKILLVQNTYANAVAKLRTIKGIVEKNEVFRALFADLLPTKECVWKGEALQLNRPGSFAEATFEAAGTGTQVTSRHYDVIIEDDTVAPEQDDYGMENVAPSEEDIGRAIGWHRLAMPLLNNPPKDQILVVGTRWAEVDLLSWIEENEPSYNTITRAAMEDANGLPDYNGVPQYKTRFDRETLKELEAALGPYMFYALYLNSPLASADMAFKPEWWQEYCEEAQELVTYTTVDLAGDPKELKGKKPDFNVVMTCGKDLASGNIYVLDYFHKRCSPGEVLDALFLQVKTWHPVKVGIESIAYQSSLIYWVRERQRAENTWFTVEKITHGKRSKSQRILGLQPVMADGRLFFRSWMQALRKELMAFPLGAFDDLADALSMQLPFWAMTRSRREVREMGRKDSPFSFSAALGDIRGRARDRQGFPKDLMLS